MKRLRFPSPEWRTKGDWMENIYTKEELQNIDAALPEGAVPKEDHFLTVMSYNGSILGRLENMLEIAHKHGVMVAVMLPEDYFTNPMHPPMFNAQKITFDYWEKHFKPTLEDSGDLHEIPFIDVGLLDQAYKLNTLWTRVQYGDHEVILAGYHWVNRLAHYVTKKPARNVIEVSLL